VLDVDERELANVNTEADLRRVEVR